MTDVPPPPSDRVAIVQGMMTFGGGQHRHPAVVERDIEALASAESEYDAMVREREEVDRISESRRRALDEAEEDVRLATEVSESERARDREIPGGSCCLFVVVFLIHVARRFPKHLRRF